MSTLYIHYCVYNRQLVGNCSVYIHRELSWHCDDLEGWDWGGVRAGGDICVPVADSHCCTAETNTTL